MNQYKPEYMGKVMPVNDPSKLTNFVANQYESFTKVYDACKNQSDNIKDIKPVDNGNTDSLSVQISADESTIEAIKENARGDDSVTIEGGVITAKT